jgi:uncharacterized protein YjbJ (UPF0337 family)
MNKDRIEGVAKQASGNVKKATGKLVGDAALSLKARKRSSPAKFRTRLAAPKTPFVPPSASSDGTTLERRSVDPASAAS